MPGTFFGLTIAQSGLAAAQFGQDVTGHNIANAATPGYSVQSSGQQAGDPYSTTLTGGLEPGQLGSGVVVGSITRSRDQYLDQQVRNATSDQSNQTTQNQALTQMEDAFGEPSKTGLNTAMGTLFQNFNNLVNNPEDLGVRSTVVESGDALSRVFQNVQDSLNSVGQQLTSNQTADIASVNSYGQQIAALNVTIRQATLQHQNANDLMDQRDVLLDKISALANVTVINNSDGSTNVAIGSSQLVTGSDAYQATLTGPNSLTTGGNLTSGDLAGLAQAQTDLAGYQSDLNNLAASVISTVNTVHQAGAGLDGTTGLNFFSGTDASSIAVNQTLVTHPEQLAAAANPGGGVKPPAGDASNATLLGALEDAPVAALSGQTLQGFFQGRISNLGGQGAATKTAMGTADSNVQQLTQQRDSISGVSTDSEMANMMRYQQAYAASAKVLQTMNDMLGTLISSIATS